MELNDELKLEEPTLKKLAEHFKKAKEHLGQAYQLLENNPKWHKTRLEIAGTYTDLDLSIKLIRRILKQQ